MTQGLATTPRLHRLEHLYQELLAEFFVLEREGKVLRRDIQAVIDKQKMQEILKQIVEVGQVVEPAGEIPTNVGGQVGEVVKVVKVVNVVDVVEDLYVGEVVKVFNVVNVVNVLEDLEDLENL